MLAIPLSTFRISDSNLNGDPTIKEPYDLYCQKSLAFGEAMSEFKEASKKLHALLDGPLRSAGLIPAGKDWTFKCDPVEGLAIQVSEPKQRRRRKAEVPLRQLPLPLQTSAVKVA